MVIVIDHVLPRQQGRSDVQYVLSLLQAVCVLCGQGRQSRDPYTQRIKLSRSDNDSGTSTGGIGEGNSGFGDPR
jgi:hypothetical protein